MNGAKPSPVLSSRFSGRVWPKAVLGRVKSAAAGPGLYVLGVGQVPWSGFHTARLSDSVSAQVDHGNGNLLATAEGSDITDAGPGPAWGATFNSPTQAGRNATTFARMRAGESSATAAWEATASTTPCSSSPGCTPSSSPDDE